MHKIVRALVALAAVFLLGWAFSSPAGAGSGDSSSQYIAPNAGTTIPVYDTAWQMFALASVDEADEYFGALSDNGFTGAWAGVIHHAPARYNDNYNGGGLIGELTDDGEVVLTPGYIAHVREILDAAEAHDQKVGLVVAWQNLYLPGGRSDEFLAKSDLVRETIDTSNAYAYGQQMVEAFGDHPAVSMWVTGGDSGSNNTDENIEVYRVMVDGIRDAGSTLDITHHLPSDYFDHFNYVGEPWLDSITPQTGHIQTAERTEEELVAVSDAYRLPVWQGEARYFNIDFDWIPEASRNPGVAEVRADAIAARNAGVAGYVYGDAGRWNWCTGFGDSTPCDSSNIADSFGAGEAATIEVFAGEPANPPAPAPLCQGRAATVSGLIGTAGDDVIVGTSSADRIEGGGGNDLICGLDGADIILGGDGDDVVYGGRGSDIIRMGPGDDRVFSGRGHDDVQGGGGNDELIGGPGNDRIVGNTGNDRLLGAPGTDRVVGNTGNDVLFGGAGNDGLYAGAGTDSTTGGAGVDVCVASETSTNCER